MSPIMAIRPRLQTYHQTNYYLLTRFLTSRFARGLLSLMALATSANLRAISAIGIFGIQATWRRIRYPPPTLFTYSRSAYLVAS